MLSLSCPDFIFVSPASCQSGQLDCRQLMAGGQDGATSELSSGCLWLAFDTRILAWHLCYRASMAGGDAMVNRSRRGPGEVRKRVGVTYRGYKVSRYRCIARVTASPWRDVASEAVWTWPALDLGLDLTLTLTLARACHASLHGLKSVTDPPDAGC